MSKRVRIYTQEDLAAHSTAESCWISHNGKVYDVTNFLKDHPGGDDYILSFAGKDVAAVMKDPEEHEHSDSAYDMLEEMVIGRVGTGEAIVSDDWEATDDFEPEETDTTKDFEKNQFLDLRQPLLKQVWQANWSKSYYLIQVHQPRHLVESAPMFGLPILDVRPQSASSLVAAETYITSGLHEDVLACDSHHLAAHSILLVDALLRAVHLRQQRAPIVL